LNVWTKLNPTIKDQRPFSSYMRALCFYIHGVKRLAGCHKEAITLWTSETNVAADFRQDNLPYALPVRRKYVYAVKTVTGPRGTGPDVSVHVRTKTISAAN
jgi:hypothetical protein